MALYRVTNIFHTGVGFSVEGSEDYTLSPGESIEVVKITQEIREFEETGHIRIDTLIPDPTVLVVDAITNDVDKAPSGHAVSGALAGVDGQIAATNTALDQLSQRVDQIIAGNGGIPIVDRFVISAENVTTKALMLSHTPLFPAAVMVFPTGGPAQRYGIDYSVYAEFITWDSLGLDNFIEEGDIVDVAYTH